MSRSLAPRITNTLRLIQAIRKGPYQVQLMLGGYDEGVGSSLYYCDYMGTLQAVNFGVQGYASR